MIVFNLELNHSEVFLLHHAIQVSNMTILDLIPYPNAPIAYYIFTFIFKLLSTCVPFFTFIGFVLSSLQEG